MKKTFHHVRCLLMLGIVLATMNGIQGCKKFLDAKPDQKLASPSSIEDVQALLDSYITMNSQAPNTGARSDDDFYLLDTYIKSRDVNSQNIYTWQKDVVVDEGWTAMYKVILNANLSLETLNAIEKTAYNETAYNNAYGSALFFRCFAFYQLLQVYAAPFHESTATTTLGIPIRLQSDISTKNERNNLASCYDRVIEDTKKCIMFLPATGNPVSRPSQAAAYSLLSNVFLTMGNYQQAGVYADSALQLQQSLMDFNAIDSNLTKPFTKFNEEVIFSSATAGNATLYTTQQMVDTTLYSIYMPNDLRKPIFFRKIAENRYGFKGNYQESAFGVLFNGFAVDEMLLIRAECHARENRMEEAIADLNTLLINRFKIGSFNPYVSGQDENVLDIILAERRKELVGRNKRWNDLRRLNRDAAFAKTLIRVVDGERFELPPGDPRYTFYIPEQVIGTTGMKQNER